MIFYLDSVILSDNILEYIIIILSCYTKNILIIFVIVIYDVEYPLSLEIGLI